MIADNCSIDEEPIAINTDKSLNPNPTHNRTGSSTLILFMLLGTAIATSLNAQEDTLHYELESVVVTASRIPTTLDRSARDVMVLRRDDLERMPVHSLPELLEYVPGIDVRQRGTNGVQADISVRGGTFEQTLVVIDGVPLRNSQTGHHNLDLPLTFADIERIEILKGPGARAYGANAYGGIVSITTRSPAQSQVVISGAVGQYGLREGYISQWKQLPGLGYHISLSKKISSGYIPDSTDFDVTTATASLTVPVGGTEINLNTGYTLKDFGAYMFYSEQYPLQREQTGTGSAQVSTRLQAGNIQLSPTLYRHSHVDTFNIQVGDTWLQNEHRTVTRGGELRALVPLRTGITAFGIEAYRDDIESSNLGERQRITTGLYGEYHLETDKLTWSSGLTAQSSSSWGWQIWPGLDALIQLSPSISVYGSADRAYRVPTFTELYYLSPANEGNPNLRPESAWTGELGLRRSGPDSQIQLALFSRWGHDIIDWVRAADTEPWEADNISSIRTGGLEINVLIASEGQWLGFDYPSFQLGYAYLDSDLDTRGLQSKYVLDHLKHQLVLALSQAWTPHLEQDLHIRYEERSGDIPCWLVDTKFAFTAGYITTWVEVTNLLDTAFREAGSVPMPGRWLRLGIQAELAQGQ